MQQKSKIISFYITVIFSYRHIHIWQKMSSPVEENIFFFLILVEPMYDVIQE